MNEITKCPRCGADQPVRANGGVCPRCAAELLQATQTDIPGESPGSFTPPTVAELAAKFPQLEILGLLGRGGMGAVYQARQKELDRLVALKILPPDIGRDAAFAERFTREARALAKLNHPGIVTIYDFGRAEGLYFFLMEFVDGMNLRELLRRQRISPREALAIVPQICDALQYAHDQGIVHRDIKPENLLIDRRGRVKVADFGLAKLMGAAGDTAGPGASPAGSPSLTEAGKVMGTPNYMSPEQVQHPGEVDHRADIYALGVVFYQMLTGELPEKQLQPPSRKVAIDVRLDEVVLRALEQQPERRYQQASTMKQQVETIAQGAAGSGQTFAAWANQGVDFKTKATLFGLPLLHVANGTDPATGRARIARGIIAVGGVAQGVVACGGVAMGGIALGGVSLGIIAYGGLGLGVLVIGGLAAGLLGAMGGLAVAPIALGGEAIGYFANGAHALGAHTLQISGSDAVARDFFNPWSERLLHYFPMVNFWLVGVAVLLSSGLPLWLAWRERRKAAETIQTPQNPLPPGTVEAWLALMDRGDYAGNWAAASIYFRKAMTREQWVSRGESVRRPLGRVLARQPATIRYKYLGTRVVVTFNTVFEGLTAAVETVTFHREPSGEWKCIGYLIRPAGFAEEGGPAGTKRRLRLVGWSLVTGLVLVLLGGLWWGAVPTGSNPRPTISPADQPFELKKQPTDVVIKTGLLFWQTPWAWQELQARGDAGRFNQTEANQLLTGLITQLRRDYPHGYDQPLNWLGTFLEYLNARHLVTETNALAFLDAYAGSPWLDPLPRLRENERTMQITCHLRTPWNNGLWGCDRLNEVGACAIDGQPVVMRAVYGRTWNQQDFTGEITLPRLLPGKHGLTCEVLSAWVDTTNMSGLASDAPAADWPPARIRKSTTCGGDFMVHAQDAVLVKLSDEPKLDPAAAGVFSLKQVMVRRQGGHLRAFLALTTAQHPGVPVSVDATLEIGGQSVNCGSLWADTNHNVTTTLINDGLGGELEPLDPQIKTADVVLTPNPRAVESQPGIDRIWGKAVRFRQVPVTRLDLSQNTSNSASPDEIHAAATSAAGILNLARQAYAALSAYRDNGWMVHEYHGDSWTNTFTEMLGARTCYQVEIITAAHPFSYTNRYWSDGLDHYWQQVPGARMQVGEMMGNLSMTVNETAVPTLYFNLSWGNAFIPFNLGPTNELFRLPDETMGGTDCYVVTRSNALNRVKLWVGKKDGLIRRYANNGNTETHENISVNQAYQREDFIPKPDGAP